MLNKEKNNIMYYFYSVAFMVCDKDNATFSTTVKAENPEKARTILTDYWQKMGKTITIYSIVEQHFSWLSDN